MTAIISPVPRSFPAKTRMKEIRNVTSAGQYAKTLCTRVALPSARLEAEATVKGIHRHNASFMISAGWNCVPAITSHPVLPLTVLPRDVRVRACSIHDPRSMNRLVYRIRLDTASEKWTRPTPARRPITANSSWREASRHELNPADTRLTLELENTMIMPSTVSAPATKIMPL